MSDQGKFSVSNVNRKRDETGETGPPPSTNPMPEGSSIPQLPAKTTAPKAPGGGLPFDPMRLVAAIARQWKLIFFASLVLAVPAAVLGWLRFKTVYSVSVQLIRREGANNLRTTEAGEPFKPMQVTAGTVTSIMKSPKLLQRVADISPVRVSPGELKAALTITTERNTDLINVTLTSQTSAESTATLVNAYAREVAALTQQMQADEAAALDKFLRDQVARADIELRKINDEVLTYSRESGLVNADKEVEANLRELSDAEVQLETAKAGLQTIEFRLQSAESELAKQNPLMMRIKVARDTLNALQLSFTEENPRVLDATEQLAALEKEGDGMTNSSGAPSQYAESTLANGLVMAVVDMRGQRDGLTKQIKQLEEFHARVKGRLQALPEKSQHYATIQARQKSLTIARDLLAGQQREAQLFAESSPGLYRLFAAATADTVGSSSRWKKLGITTVGAFFLGGFLALLWVVGGELMDLRVVTAKDLERTSQLPVVARIADLDEAPQTDLPSWRFRAWARLVRELGWQNESHIILGVTSARAGEGRTTLVRHLRDAARDRQFPVLTVTNAALPDAGVQRVELAEALATPELVHRHWREHAGAPLELHHDGDWKWSLEERARWQRAVESWRSISQLALLVELPPMEQIDAVLAAEMLPAIVWVTASGTLEQRELASTLETVRAGEVNVAAAILNRERSLFGSVPWLGRLGLALLAGWLAMQTPGIAAETNSVVATPKDYRSNTAGLSASGDPEHLAPWQERFEVGPGDLFHLSIYGHNDTIRLRVPVGPDGRISFLEAQSVPAAGLTVDELRARLDEILGRYYKHARTIISPVEWRSKKYFVLGTVLDRGAYTLDRPLTIIEAVARARGIATGLSQQNTVELADMPRAFIVRQGKRLPVDFQKLFNEGDLSQNYLIEPGDYLYFPSGSVNEVYVLGAVGSPGPQGLSANNSLVGLLTVRGGFTPKAYKQRVLIIRGALQKPETIAVNVADILSGRARDFELKPKDIVYVAEKPWQDAADLLQVAVNAFVQSMTTTWVSENMPALIRYPILPNIK